jgi:hypothetical protein
MSAIYLSKQDVIHKLNNLKRDITQAHEKQQKLVTEYNKVMQDNFGFIEDGKPLDKLEIIDLIQKLITSDKIK